MFKNTVILLLSVGVVIFWLKEEPDDTFGNDPNEVVIEYRCSDIDEYQDVPSEVISECRARGLLKNSI